MHHQNSGRTGMGMWRLSLRGVEHQPVWLSRVCRGMRYTSKSDTRQQQWGGAAAPREGMLTSLPMSWLSQYVKVWQRKVQGEGSSPTLMCPPKVSKSKKEHSLLPYS